jgi:hypothetical protein
MNGSYTSAEDLAKKLNELDFRQIDTKVCDMTKMFLGMSIKVLRNN